MRDLSFITDPCLQAMGKGYPWMKGSVHPAGRFWKISRYFEGERYWFKFDPFTLERFRTKFHALQVLNAMWEEGKRGEFDPKHWLPNAPLSLKTYVLDEWLPIKTVSKKTLTDYQGYFDKWIIHGLGEGKDIRRIRANDIIRVMRSIDKRLAPEKYNAEGVRENGKIEKHTYNIISCLRTMLNDAYRNEDIRKVPPFPILSYEVSQIEEWTIEQQGKWLAEIPARDRPIFECGCEYGLRTQEVRAIQKNRVVWEPRTLKSVEFPGKIKIDCKFVDNRFTESTKTGEKGIRELPITSHMADVLAGLNDLYPESYRFQPFLFIRVDGKPYTNKNLNKIHDEACKRIGYKIKLQNAFRHSLGCQLLDLGYDLDTIRDILGHTTLRMTRRYAKRRLETKGAVLEQRRRGNVVELRR